MQAGLLLLRSFICKVPNTPESSRRGSAGLL
jgi:hypothetical protein